MQAGTSTSAKALVQPTVQANKEHQYALKVYTERLEAELEHLDKLLTAAEVSDNEEDDYANAGGSVSIPGAARPKSIIPLSDLISETSPFYHEALRKQCYEDFTVVHPMKAAELEALADAVRSENYRLYALQSQAQGLPSFTGLNDPPAVFINTNKHGIDWERVAQKQPKVSSASASVQRTARECEIRWLGDRHPQYSDAQWTQAEIAKVRELVGGDAREGEIDWVKIAEELGTGRTPVDCMRHAIMRRTHSWTPDTDKRLLDGVNIYGTDCWALVARYVSEDATASQCQSRYLRTLDPTLKRGPWTPDEDERLKQAVAVFGHAWVDVAPFVEGRNNEQCRDRYQEYLSPSVAKGKWTEDQDAALLKAVEEVGLGKWKEVSKVLNIGRTDNMCRIRYGILTKPKKPSKAAVPAPIDTQWIHEVPSQSTSKAPSRARTRQPSSRSTPAQQSTSMDIGQSQFLILHPESYISPSGSSTPAPETIARPKPRPRRKKPQATMEDVEPTRVERSTDTSLSGESSIVQATPPSEDPSADATQKRRRAETGDDMTPQIISLAGPPRLSLPRMCRRQIPLPVYPVKSRLPPHQTYRWPQRLFLNPSSKRNHPMWTKAVPPNPFLLGGAVAGGGGQGVEVEVVVAGVGVDAGERHQMILRRFRKPNLVKSRQTSRTKVKTGVRRNPLPLLPHKARRCTRRRADLRCRKRRHVRARQQALLPRWLQQGDSLPGQRIGPPALPSPPLIMTCNRDPY
ncbi:hypothetical protein C2E23DRAFT_915021 [Lenzites betulinus]|nr:hypothetical protein C2E23DRAFT_915021 [Lenzites betulinus]